MHICAIFLFPGDNLGCFGASKKKKETQPVQQKETASTSRSTTQRTEPVKGMGLLWQPEVQDLASVF
jgi:hypothetical protein